MTIDLDEYTYYIRPGYTDMRKGPAALAYIVQEEMGLPAFGKSVFVFCGRSRRTVKAIVWDRNGWWVLSKRLQCGMGFKWPESREEALKVGAGDLAGMLAGKDVWRTFPRYEPELVG